MKVSREQARENRTNVLDAASRLFRERGVDNVSVAQVMHAAGLTHGGFYAIFENKNDLVAQAAERALVEQTDQWRAVIETADGDAFNALISFYVSALHRDMPGAGCALAALAVDAARGDSALQSVFNEGLEAYVELLASVAPDRTRQQRRQRALSAIAAMIGAVVLSRATASDAISDEVLHCTAQNLTCRPE